MEWYEADAIRKACLARAISEERALEILRDNLDDLRIVCAQRSDAYDRAEDPRHPLFNRVQEVTQIDVETRDKVVEFTDDASGLAHLEKVPATTVIAYGEWYTVTGGAGIGAVGPVRRTRDEVRSGTEVFKKDADGRVHQYGAATAMLARLLEVKAIQPPPEA